MKNIYKSIKKFSIEGKLAVIIIFLIFLMALFAPFLTEFSHTIPSGKSLEPPSLKHWLGTDDLGIDLWSQICFGTRISIIVGLGTALIAGLGGSIIGIISGYFGGKTDRFIMRFTDAVLVIPRFPMMIVLGAFFGASIKNIIIVLSLFSWTAPARIIRSKILSIKEEAYIKSAKSFGAGFWHMTLKHFLPEIFPLVMVSFIKLISKAVVAEASLSFIGLGDPTSKSWGIILHHAVNFPGIYFTDFWKWWLVTPIVAITIFVLAFAFICRDLERVTEAHSNK